MIQGFLLGQGAAPDDYATRRAMIQAMMPQFGRASTIGEGLGQLFTGIGLGRQQSRLDREEAAARQSAMDQFNSAFSGGTAQPGGFSILGQTPPTPGQAVANDTMAALGYDFAPGDRESFIKAITPYAEQAARETGLDPRIIIAQAAQETGWGKHAPGNNFFGIKSHGQPGGQTLATTEYANGSPVSTQDSFRGYGSLGESVMDYARFLKENPRYASMLSAPDLNSQVEALGKSGYATDPNYAFSVGAIANSLPGPRYSNAQLAAAAANPMLPEAMRAQAAQMLADQQQAEALAMKQQDPLYQQQLQAGQLGIQRDQLELAQMQQPKPGYRLLTGQEAAQMGLPQGVWQMAPDGQVSPIQQPATQRDALAELDARARAAGLQPGTEEYKTFMLRNGSVADQGRALSIIWGRDAQGNPIPMQASPDGTLQPSKLPEGIIPLDPASKSYETALGAAMGKNAGDAQNLLPAQQTRVDQIDSLIQSILEDPKLPDMLGPIDSRLPDWTEDRARMRGKLDQLQGGAFLQARTDLKGGGAITDFESRQAEQAFLRATQAQSPEDFAAALNDFRDLVKQGYLKLQQQAVQNPNQRYTGQQPYGQPATINGYTIEEVK